MNFTSQHLTGMVIGIGVAAVGYYAYKKNQPAVDDFLRRQGIQLPESSGNNYATMTLEELVAEKEHLEDIIAERELATNKEVKSVK